MLAVPSASRRPSYSSGFGLLELMVALCVLAILSAVALPSFNTAIKGNRTSTQSSDLVAALSAARNEAVVRNRSISICAADPSAGTPSACGAAADWSKGWVLFLDAKTDTTAPGAIASADILRVGVFDATVTVTGDVAFIRFSSRGEMLGTAARTFNLKPATGCKTGQRRQVTVTVIGRIGTKRVDACT